MAATYQPSQWLIPKNENTDKVGNYSFEFDGATTSIGIGDLSTLNGATELTFSFWGKKATGDILGIEAFNTANDKVILYWWSDNNVYWGVRSGATPTSATSALADFSNWHHFAGTYNGSTGAIELYIDGSSVDTQTGAPAATTDLSADFVIGKSNGTSFGEGSISEVCVFNYALSSENVTSLYGSAGAGVGNPMGLDVVPIAYYKGDNAALGDQWAVANQGALRNYAFYFNGNKQYISVPGVTAFDNVTSFSVSVWVKPTNFIENNRLWEQHYSVHPGSDTAYWVVCSIPSPGQVLFLINNGSDNNYGKTTTTLAADTWSHVAFTYDGTGVSDSDKMKVYINGIDNDDLVFTGTIPSSTATWTSPQDFNIGTNYSVTMTDSFLGNISNMAIWTSTLSPANITTIYNNGIPGDLTSLSPVDWWKLDSSATWTTSWSIPDDGSASNVGTSNAMTEASLVGTDVNTAGTTLATDYSFSFDGIADYATFPSFNSLVSLSSFSISFWANFTSVGASDIIMMHYSVLGLKAYINSNKMSVGFPGNGSASDFVTSPNVIPTDTWTNYTFTYDNVDLKLYENGVLVQTNNSAGKTYIANTGQNLLMGKYWFGGQFLDGNLSNVAIWNSTLTAANALTIYNNGRPSDLTSLSPTNWWMMGERASWDGANWTIADQAGSVDGTTTGNPDLVGEAPQSFANGLSVSMDIDDRIGESGFSDENALSYNMGYDARKADVPG